MMRFTRLATMSMLAAIAAAHPATAQDRGEINVFGGIQFGGDADIEDDVLGNKGEIDLDSGVSYGGMVGYRVRKDAMIVLGYHRQQTSGDVSVSGVGALGNDFDLDIGFLQFGGEVELPNSTKLLPYFGMTIGAAHYTPDVSALDTEWYFAGQLYGGVKVPITERLGLRTQIAMVTTVIQNDSEFICVGGAGGACLVSRDVTALFQGNFTAGVYFLF